MKNLILTRYACLLIGSALLFSGCSPLIWPTAYQVPSTEQKGDLQLDALSVTTTATLQAAYSPADHLVLTGAYNNKFITETKGHEYNNTSFGLGYYTGNDRNQTGVLAQYTFGTSQDNNIRTENGQDMKYYARAAYRKYQLQPYVRLRKPDGNSEFYLGFRSSVVQIQSFSSTDETRINPGNHVTFEPFTGWRIGTPTLKLDLQLGFYAHKKSYIEDSRLFNIKDNDGLLNLHIGVTYNVNLFNKTRTR